MLNLKYGHRILALAIVLFHIGCSPSDDKTQIGTLKVSVLPDRHPTQLRVLWKLPPFADYTWAIQTNLSDKLKYTILDAFLKLSYDNPAHRKILDGVGAKAYFPSKVDDFSILENVARQLKFIRKNED